MMIEINDIYQIIFYLAALIVLSPLLGNFISKVFLNQKNVFNNFLCRIEKTIFGFAGIDIKSEMDWKKYTVSLLVFNMIGIVVLFLLQVFQYYLPFNPQKLQNVEIFLALNTAVSFVTNTNWQSYAGETTLSYLVQMAGLTVQNFVSAGTGIAVLLALTRSLTTKQGSSIGNFWNDLSKSVLYIFFTFINYFCNTSCKSGVCSNIFSLSNS